MDKNKNIKYLIIHHTGGTVDNPLADTSHHTFYDVNLWHRTDQNVWLGYYSSLGFSIGYHYFIDKTGQVTQGRAHTDEGAHCRGHNTESIGICLAGNFDVTSPTKEQENSLKTLLLDLKKEYPLASITPHRTFANKSCYGRRLGDTWASDLVTKIDPPMCRPEKDEIVELKKKLAWYESMFLWFAERFS